MTTRNAQPPRNSPEPRSTRSGAKRGCYTASGDCVHPTSAEANADRIRDIGRLARNGLRGNQRMISAKPTSRPRSCEFGLDLTSGLLVTRPQTYPEREDVAMAERPTSFAQQEILAAVDLRKERLSMSQKKVSSGVVHELPADLKKAIASNPRALAAWEDITPLARNEWICWIESARKAETRSRRIAWGCSSLKDGKRRPCCWPGCDHR